MSIYSDIVTNELFRWIDRTSGDRLVDYTLSCRAEMFAARGACGEDPLALLAAEITYDRALIKLCKERGIELDDADFASPRTTRLFLEYELYRSGVDLHALACATSA
jgi:hypothetical protein